VQLNKDRSRWKSPNEMTEGKAPSMKNTRRRLAARYLTALRTHLGKNGRRNNGDQAQDLGRAAVAAGLAPLDLAVIHERAVATLASSHDFTRAHRNGFFKRKGYFFTQALIPLEAAHRATRDTNRELQRRNKVLRLLTFALSRTNRRLQREIARREAGEAALKKGHEQYRTLFLE
jgi:hypothetical protein